MLSVTNLPESGISTAFYIIYFVFYRSHAPAWECNARASPTTLPRKSVGTMPYSFRALYSFGALLGAFIRALLFDAIRVDVQ